MVGAADSALIREVSWIQCVLYWKGAPLYCSTAHWGSTEQTELTCDPLLLPSIWTYSYAAVMNPTTRVKSLSVGVIKGHYSSRFGSHPTYVCCYTNISGQSEWLTCGDLRTNLLLVVLAQASFTSLLDMLVSKNGHDLVCSDSYSHLHEWLYLYVYICTEARARALLLQQVSVALQRGNAASVLGSMGSAWLLVLGHVTGLAHHLK